MKILIIISNPEMGGAQRVSINLSEWLNRQDNTKASILALSHRSTNAYDMSKYDYTYLHSKYKVFELRKIVKKIKPDIVLTMGVPLCIYSIPAVIGLPLIHFVSERNDPAHFAGKKLTAVVSRFFMRFADKFVFQTEEARDFYGGKIAKNSKIIPNPLFNLDKMPSKPFTGDREKKIVTVGRLNPQKNHTLLIKSFALISSKYPEYTLEIWGDGSERQKLENLINSLGLKEQIRLCGTSNDIFNCIYRSSFFVMSSDFEGMPNALMEAMALGLPVISTNCPCGGPSFLIKDNVNGLLTSVNDEKELATKMDELLSNTSKAKEIGNEAFKIRNLLSEQNINKCWYQYFKSNIK